MQTPSIREWGREWGQSGRDTWDRLPNPAKLALKALLWVVGVLFLLWLILFITKGRFLERPFERIATNIVGREVSVGGDFQLYSNPHIKFRAEKLVVANPTWAEGEKFIDSDLIDLRIDILRLIFGDILFRRATLKDTHFALEWDEAGVHNSWTFGEARGEPFRLPKIREAAIAGTSLAYRDPPRQLFVDLSFAPISARSNRFGQSISFQGRGTSMREPFRVSGRLESPDATAAGGRNDMTARIEVGDSRIDVAGTLPGVTELDGALLNLHAEGGNLATPFLLLGVAVPETRRFDLGGELRPVGNEWRMTKIAGTFGDSDLSGSMTVRTGGERLFIAADLASRALDILDAGPWIGIPPERLDRMGGKGAITSEGGRPRVLPNAPLNADGLSRFDARIAYRAAAVRTGTIPLQNLQLTLGLDNRLLTLKPVRFDFAGGTLTGNIDLNARRTPVVTHYDVNLSPVRISELLSGFDIDGTGTKGVLKGRLNLTGYGNDVRESLGSANGRIAVILPQGDFWIRNAELLELDIGDFVEAALGDKLKEPARIRCGLIAFTVKDGIGRADPIFIDTRKNVIRGGGTISFKDESLDLAVEADAKNPSLFSGQSPIGVGGWFAAPTVNPISGELAGRAVAGGVLGALISPLAVLIAFIDLGDEEDTNCAPVLAGASGAAVRAADKAAEKKKSDG
jgi:AsmA family protein